MASVNKVIIVGNLGRDPEVRYTPNGSAVCNVSVATTRSWKNKESGDKSRRPSGIASSSTTSSPRSPAST